MIRFDDKLAAFAIAKAANVQLTPFAMCVSQHDADGALEGGALFEGYNGATVYTHVAGFAPGWARPAWLYAVSDLCFRHLKVRQVLGVVSVDNKKAVDFDTKFGFVPLVTLPGYFPEGDAYLMRLTEDRCRFLGDPYRKRYDRERHANAKQASRAS